MTPTLLRLCSDIMLTDDEVVMDFGLPPLTDAEVATLNDAIGAHTGCGNTHDVKSAQPEVSTWVLVGACAVLLKKWADALPAFAEDDRVVAHKFESRPSTTQRGGVLWLECMAETVGRVGVVVDIDRDGDVKVEFGDGVCWAFPPEALTPATAT